MSKILDLVNTEFDDHELAPEILPVDARLSIRGTAVGLAALFDRAASVSPTKEIIAGTAYSLLEAFSAENGTASYIQVTSTDGEHSLVVVADGVQVILAGAALLPAKKVLDILKLAPEEMVRLDVIGNSARIRSGQAQWTVQTPAGDALPPMPDVSDIELVGMSREKFLEALVVARKAASTQTARSSLMQVQVKNRTITGADGSRGHRQRVDELSIHTEMDIPLKVVDELIRALQKSESSEFELGGNDQHLAFRIDQDILIAQRLLLRFPDVEKMFLGPALNNEHLLTIKADDFAAVVKRVRVNADPDFAGIYIGLVPGKKDDDGYTHHAVRIRARDKTGNSAQETLQCRWEGPAGAREILVNHKHLLDLLTSYSGELIRFRVGDDSKTMRRALYLDDPESGFTAVIGQMMPNWSS